VGEEMLDYSPEDQGPDRPTWEDIERIIQSQIDHCCNHCSHAIKHQSCFEGDGSQVSEIIALASNQYLRNVITNIIAELIAIDPTDFAFRQFIKRLKLRLKNYELVSAS
jgi:hypothetical protein